MRLDLLGRTIDADDALDPRLTRWLVDDLVGPVAAARPGTSAGPDVVEAAAAPPAPFVVELRAGTGGVPAPVRGHQVETGATDARHVRLGGDRFWVLDAGGEGGVHGVLLADGARLEVHGDPVDPLVLQLAVGEALIGSGLVLLHAAVVHDGGRTVALLGPSGRGKSTTTVRAVQTGWQPVTDDSAWLDLASLQLVAADERLRLLPGTHAAELLRAQDGSVVPVVGSSASVVTVAADGKHEFAYDRVGARRRTASLTDLAVLERGGSPDPGWSALSRAAAVMALHEAAGIAHTDRAGRVLAEGFGSVVRRTTAWRLHLGAERSRLPPLPPPPSPPLSFAS